MNLNTLFLIASLGGAAFYFNGCSGFNKSPEDVKGAVASAAAYSSLDNTPVEEAITKVPRSECEHCHGTGHMKSGDGIKVVDCPYCYPDSKSGNYGPGERPINAPLGSGSVGPVDHKCNCGPGCNCKGECKCEIGNTCVDKAAAQAAYTATEEAAISQLIGNARAALEKEDYSTARQLTNEAHNKIVAYAGPESVGAQFLELRRACDKTGMPLHSLTEGPWAEKFSVVNKADYEAYVKKMTSVWQELQVFKKAQARNVTTYSKGSSCGAFGCGS